MTDHQTQIDRLTKQHEQKCADLLQQAIDQALAGFDMSTLAAILFNAADDLANADDDADRKDTIDHYSEQMDSFIGTDDNDSQLAGAIDDSGMFDLIGSFFAAILALAGAAIVYIPNANASDAITARDSAFASFRAAFLHESLLALRQTGNLMLAESITTDTRAAQIRRVIGLTSAQARSLFAMRRVLYNAIQTGNAAKPATLLATVRGNLSAAQIKMLTKALEAGVTVQSAEALLNRHASAMRAARIKVVAGDTIHHIAETAKLTAWQLAQHVGVLPADQRKFWQTAGDEKVRTAHAQVPGMNPNGVPLNQPFATPLGPCFAPPLEVNCRCKAVLR